MRVFRFTDDPVVQRTVILKFQRAERMRDALDRVLDGVGKIVHGINTPGVPGIVVGHMGHTVEDRIAHIDVGAGHIDLGAQCLFSVRKLAGAHALKEVQIFLYAAVPVGIILPWLRECATVLPHLLRGQVRDIGLSLFDQFDSDFVHLLEIIGGKEQPVLIFSAQPLDIRLDGLDKFDLFLCRVGIVKTEIEFSAVLLCHTVIEQDTLGMTDVQIAVGFRGETGVDIVIDPVPEVFVDLPLNKMAAYLLLFRHFLCRVCRLIIHVVKLLLYSIMIFSIIIYSITIYPIMIYPIMIYRF